jgi:hypothetical protein
VIAASVSHVWPSICRRADYQPLESCLVLLLAFAAKGIVSAMASWPPPVGKSASFAC